MVKSVNFIHSGDSDQSYKETYIFCYFQQKNEIESEQI